MNIFTHFSKKQKCVQYKSSQGHKPWRCTASNGEQITNLRRHAHSILKLSYSTVKLKLIIDWTTILQMIASGKWRWWTSPTGPCHSPRHQHTRDGCRAWAGISVKYLLHYTNVGNVTQMFAALHKWRNIDQARPSLSCLCPSNASGDDGCRALIVIRVEFNIRHIFYVNESCQKSLSSQIRRKMRKTGWTCSYNTLRHFTDNTALSWGHDG